MSVSLFVEFDTHDLERIHADLVVVGFAPEDRPLIHSAGRADWRLCGRLWNLIGSKRLTGRLGEAALLTVDGGLRAPLLLALGLGPRGSLDADTWGRLGEDAANRILDLRVQRTVLGLASDALDLGTEAFQSLICGAAVVVAARGADLRFVLAGEDAAARFPALQSLSKNRLPSDVGLRLSNPRLGSGGSVPGLTG